MKKLMFGAALIAAGSLGLASSAHAHGGTYRGPGDTVPPAGGGGGGGGAPASGGSPNSPGPGGSGSPGVATPGQPAGNPGNGGSSTSGGASNGPDLTVWQYWWGFNKEPYLNLKHAIHHSGPQTGSAEFYLGEGEKGKARDSLAPSERTIREKIVPALQVALRTERQNDILDASMIALAKIGDTEAEDGTAAMADDIKKFLTHSSQQLSETAAVSLGILANDSADNVGILLGLFRNDSAILRNFGVPLTGSIQDRTRAFAAYGLGLIGNRGGEEVRLSVNAAMAELLDGEGKRLGTRDIQVAALTAMGLTPLPIDPVAATVALENEAKASGWPKPTELASRQDQILFLMNYFEDVRANNHLICAHAPIAVARLLEGVQNDDPLRNLVATRFLRDAKGTTDASTFIQQSCIQALGLIGDCDEDPIDAEIRTALMGVAKAVKDTQARHYALIALGQAAGRPGRGSGNPVGGLLVKKDNPRSYLLGQLAKAKSDTRPWAALGLAIMERSLDDAKHSSSLDSKRALREALRDAKSPDEVGGYAIAVGLTRDSGSQEVLRKKFDRTSQNEARGFCAVGLGLIGDTGSIESIQEVIAESKYKPDLLKSAAVGLGLLGDKNIVDQLIEMLDQAAGLSSQAALASALGFIGDQRSVDPLIAMLQDDQKTGLARGFAAAALGIVADKESLPWNAKVSVNINYRANTTTLTSPEAGTGILDLL